MKNKRLIALAAVFICFAVLLTVLIWSIFRNPVTPEKTEPADQTSGQEADSNEKEESAADKEPVVDQKPSDKGESNEEKEPATDDASDKDEPVVDKEPVTEKEPVVENEPDTENEPDDEDEPDREEEPVKPANRKEEIEAILNDPFVMLVNRDHLLKSDYVPKDLVTYNGNYKLNSTCSKALRRLIEAGRKAGYNYTLYSAYRTYSTQYNKYYNKIAYWKNQGYSEKEAIRLTDEYYAPPGGSEHHTGLAADVCIPAIVNKYACLHENYDQTEEFKWFSKHAHEYGFILRYPKGDEAITGYSYEPWHYRYVGVKVATEIYKKGVVLEEYLSDLKAELKTLE